MKKKLISMLAFASMISTNTITAFANPTFDTTGAKELVSGYWEGLLPFLMFLIPIIGLGASLWTTIRFLAKSDEEKEQKPLLKSLKPIVIATIIGTSMSVILNIVGAS